MAEDLQPTDPPAVGPYQLVKRLGAGGMGQVYLGRSPGGRLVAVKVIRPELSADPGFRARFAREAAAARTVSGVYTAPVVDADPDGPQPWLATAYVPGPSLTDAVNQNGPLAPAAVISLGAGLAEGLQAIHAAGLVHRDLKPSNVLLADDGPRVIDFGISRAVDGSMLTQAGTVMGSPGFLSPEQAEGHEVGTASDVFSLGAVLVFAAAGQGPFGTGAVASLVYRVVNAEPSLAGVPDPLRPLIERCLAKDPASRPTAGQLLTELAAVARAVPGARPDGHALTALATGLGRPSGPSEPGAAVAGPAADARWNSRTSTSNAPAAAAVAPGRPATPATPAPSLPSYPSSPPGPPATAPGQWPANGQWTQNGQWAPNGQRPPNGQWPGPAGQPGWTPRPARRNLAENRAFVIIMILASMAISVAVLVGVVFWKGFPTASVPLSGASTASGASTTASARAPASPAAAGSAAPSAAVDGVWTGTYTCNQGLSGVRLTISGSSGDEVSARVDFYHVASNPGVASGSYEMIGNYSAARGLALVPDYWIIQPPGYQMVSLSAAGPRGNSMTGDVVGENCTTFSVKKG